MPRRLLRSGLLICPIESKRENIMYTKTAAVRAVRRARADDVASASGYSALGTKQKLERILAWCAVPVALGERSRGESKRQVARLTALLQKESEPKKAPEQATKAAKAAHTAKTPDENQFAKKSNKK